MIWKATEQLYLLTRHFFEKRSRRHTTWTYFSSKWSKIFKDNHVVLLNKTRILLNKLAKKPLLSSEFVTSLSPWDLIQKGQTRDHQWVNEKCYVTDKADFWWRGWNEREEPNSQWYGGIHLCYVQNVLTSTVIEKTKKKKFSPWSPLLIPDEGPNIEVWVSVPSKNDSETKVL